jgi:hypothetical protein
VVEVGEQARVGRLPAEDAPGPSATTAECLADALRVRGADEVTARLAAEVGLLAFSTAYARWAAPENAQPFSEIARAALRELQASAVGLAERTPFLR